MALREAKPYAHSSDNTVKSLNAKVTAVWKWPVNQ